MDNETQRDFLIYFGCALTFATYAYALYTPKGVAFTDKHAWASVVGGTAIAFMWASLKNFSSVLDVLPFFAIGGIILIARSFILIYRRGYD